IIILCSRIPEPELEAAKANPAKSSESTMSSVKGALSYRHFVLGIIAIFVYVGVEVGIPNIANIYMTSHMGITAGVAGTVVGMYWLLMLVGRLVGGAIGSKVSSRTMMICVTSVAICFLLLGMFLPEKMVEFPAFKDFRFTLEEIPLGVVFFVLCGLCTSVMWGSIFNLAVEGLGKYTSIASGLFMVMVCGGGIIPWIQGAVADAFGYIESYWVLVVAVAYMLFFALWGSKPSKKAEI
ncbi:MAG: MFS transporter, partial [Bacteroidetes bacterium]|nr:MFS transporter [Candidatus Cryptobacteroides merdigallinarum]